MEYFSYISGMKKCSKCNVVKDLSEYYKYSNGNPYGYCKKCKVEQSKKHPNKGPHKPDGFYYVYCLPNADYYVGKTKDLNHRLSNHKYMNKRDITDVIILHKCKTDEEALWYEKVYHDAGFEGKHNPIPIKYRHKKTLPK